MATLDIGLLRTFAAIVDTGSFTRAGARLGLTQSAVSLHMRRLEAAAGRMLIRRNARALALTPEGEALLPHARRMIDLNDAAIAELGAGRMKGAVRLGTPEDFATVHLPDVLAAFAAEWPDVALEVTCDLTLNLIERHRGGAFDMILIKREPYGAFGEGVSVWRERLVWARGPKAVAALDAAPGASAGPLPLVVAPPPCVYRKRATEALDRAGIAWRAAYVSPSLAGAQAAVRAGLGIVALPELMVPADFMQVASLPGGAWLPDLAETEIALLSRAPLGRPAALLRDRIIAALETERGQSKPMQGK
jgi:DNA-binding transcriptional LysR family regulator